MAAKPFPSPDPNSRTLARLLAWARLMLWWERLLGLAWPIPALLLTFAGLALLDLPPRLPGAFHAILLLAFALAFLAALWRLRRLSRPTIQQARRRLEQDNQLAHRPLQSLADNLAAGQTDPVARLLWEVQRKSLLALIPRLHRPRSRPVLPAADPLGLRFASLLLVAVALAATGGQDLSDRLGRSLTPELDALNGPPPLLQLWATPPEYTHIAPMLISSLPAGQTLSLPAGTNLLAELQGGLGSAKLGLNSDWRTFRHLSADSQRLERLIEGNGRLEVRQGFHSLGQWIIAVIEDRPPTIALTAPPQPDPQGRLRLELEGHDDYGIAKAWAVLRRLDQPQMAPLVLELPIASGGHPTDLRQTLWQDLTGHVWAGLRVSIQPVAEDDAGQKGLGQPMDITLPERHFVNPVAQAIAVQRRRLAQAPDDRRPVMVALVNLAQDLDSYHGDLLVFLALSDAVSRLRWDSTADAVPSLLELLWQTALRLEEGDRPIAEKALTEAQRALEEALAAKAPPQEIQRLITAVQAALDQYLDALVQDALRHGLDQIPPNPDQPTVNPQDLQAMVEQMRDLARTGSREAALDMLRQLRQMMEGLHGSFQPAKPADAEKARQAQQALDGLSTLLRDQHQLLDQTFHRQQQNDGDHGLGILGQERGSAKSRPADLDDLSNSQSSLRKRLGDSLHSLEQLGAEIPKSLGQADRAMADAIQSLKQSDLPDAVDAQTEAVARLQEGRQQAMQSLSRQIGSGLSVGPPQPSTNGSGGNGRDPLGRPLHGATSSAPNDQVVPKQADTQKAKEVLDELRRRSGEATRPPDERDYLQRLLKSFF